ncbi:MAG: hypothetical protein U5J62_08370 [Desulfurivibrio sp.]|nr:hypothetical protein [Desulfurivibrio sp.]
MYDDDGYKWEEALDQISKDLYPGHKEQAIEEFTTERLQSFYLKHPNILTSGIQMYIEAQELQENHPSASYVFATSAIELFLKGSLLKPVIYGLVHNESLAEIIVDTALGSTGFERYKKLLAGLFSEIAGIDINKKKNHGSNKPLLQEASEIQSIRNKIIHQGLALNNSDATFAIGVAYGVLHGIINPMLLSIGLWMDKDGTVLERKEGRHKGLTKG